MRRNGKGTLLKAIAISIMYVSGVPLLAQLYAPSSSHSENWVCVDQDGYVIPYASFQVWTHPFGYSNYHYHNTLRPSSTPSPSSGSAGGTGVFTFNLNTTLVGQAEYEDIYCANQYGYAWGQQSYWVGYADIYFNNHPESYIHIGGDTTNHGDNNGNHWMQSWPAYGYWYAVNQYMSQYNSGNQVCANDMALPYGGKFDIYQNWTSPHASHDRGTAVDTATTANQCPSANVVTNPSAFLQACLDNSAALPPISQIDPADVHCNWANPSTYPH